MTTLEIILLIFNIILIILITWLFFKIPIINSSVKNKNHEDYINKGYKYYHWRGIRYFRKPNQSSIIQNSHFDKYFEGKSYAKNIEELKQYLAGKAITLIWHGEIK